MLTDADSAPGAMPFEPNPMAAIPKPKRIMPIPDLKLAGGLYLLSHIFEKIGASVMINNEFKVENHVAGISVNGMVTLSIFKKDNVLSDSDK